MHSYSLSVAAEVERGVGGDVHSYSLSVAAQK